MEAGPTSVTASLPLDYFRTTPGTVFFDVTLGVDYEINFGYQYTPSVFGVIYGTVFEEDIDYEKTKDNPLKHSLVSAQMLEVLK